MMTIISLILILLLFFPSGKRSAVQPLFDLCSKITHADRITQVIGAAVVILAIIFFSRLAQIAVPHAETIAERPGMTLIGVTAENNGGTGLKIENPKGLFMKDVKASGNKTGGIDISNHVDPNPNKDTQPAK